MNDYILYDDRAIHDEDDACIYEAFEARDDRDAMRMARRDWGDYSWALFRELRDNHTEMIAWQTFNAKGRKKFWSKEQQ